MKEPSVLIISAQRLPVKADNKMSFADIQKKRGNLPVTRPTHRGSGIAQLVRTSNAEAHASMYIDTTVVCSQ